MAIFKCKMCSHYDGEWCRKSNIIKMRCKPHESCPECRIKITDKLSFCPFQTVMPNWMVWVLARLAFSTAVVMTAFLAFFAVYFTGGAISYVLTWSTPLVSYYLGSAIICTFLTMPCYSCAAWLHKKYF